MGPHLRLRLGLRGRTMAVDYWLGAAISVLLVSYLVYALLRAERF